jgi:DNA-binding GntR family transcriptional regulator
MTYDESASSSPDLLTPSVPAVLRGDDAYDRIRRDLLSCKLMPGSTVTESQLMSEYDIGKTSCRIALVRLVHEGFVRSLPRQGYRIAAITLKDVEEVFALRVQLEPLAARLACGRVDVELLRRLEAACRIRSGRCRRKSMFSSTPIVSFIWR